MSKSLQQLSRLPICGVAQVSRQQLQRKCTLPRSALRAAGEVEKSNSSLHVASTKGVKQIQGCNTFLLGQQRGLILRTTQANKHYTSAERAFAAKQVTERGSDKPQSFLRSKKRQEGGYQLWREVLLQRHCTENEIKSEKPQRKTAKREI